MKTQKTIVSICLTLLFPYLIHATAYHIGPNQNYTETGSVPWVALQAGDTVFIHWRSSPYPTKVFLRAQGSPEQPVVIRGVPNAAGEYPILTGENATTDPQFETYFDSQWTEDLGMFLIYRGPEDDYYTDFPSNIVFEYLQLTGVKPENTFTDQFGNVRHYNNFSSAIHALIVQGLTVRHCKIYDNAQGVFTNSYGGGMAQMSTNLLIEYSEIWGNGNADPYGKEHNIYAQSLGTIIQFNKIGRLREGSVGASIKDRSSGTIIRYNWIEASARTLDLVEAEDGWEITTAQSDYHDVYVYGNIFTNYLQQQPYGINNIHYGYDNSPELAKKGTLYFFHNTIYFETDQDIYWYVRLFDVSSNESQVDMYNNIVHLTAAEGASAPSEFHLMRDYGILNIYGKNWIQEGYLLGAWQSEAIVNFIEPPITGQDPGFVLPDSENFELLENSPCIDQAFPLPPEFAENHPIDKQYAKHANWTDRMIFGQAADLGAFERENSTSTFHLHQLNSKFKIYPNPVTNYLYLPTSQFLNCKIYHSNGQLAAEIQGPQNSATINLSNLPHGFYFLLLQTSSGTKTAKFAK